MRHVELLPNQSLQSTSFESITIGYGFMYTQPCSCRSMSRTIAGTVSPTSLIKSSLVTCIVFMVLEQAV